jgi:DNA-binding LacI/PurR family transcriptional regulator
MDPAKRPPPASIRDVAARAGVSRQTVSRVLNDQPGMTAETAERVRAVIAELGYRPNRAARILASSRHRTIGLILTAPTMFGPASIAVAIERAAREHGYVLASIAPDDEDEQSLSAAFTELIQLGVDGIIVIAPQASAGPAVQRHVTGLPTLTLQWSNGIGHTVGFDQRAAARTATRHLTELGHRRILHLGGPEGAAEVQQREEGYLDALIEVGADPLPTVRGDWTADSGYAAGLEVLRRQDFTAVFAANDQMAIGLLHAARDLGTPVPERLSVVGFDDIPEARHAAPPLTTIRLRFPPLGEAAIARIVGLIEGRPIDEGLLPDISELLVRESTAASWD